MPNAFQSTVTGLGILKNYYQGPIVSQFNDELKVWRGSEKGKHPWSGLQVNRPLKTRRNQGIGATSDGGNLPTIGKQTVVQATIPAAFNYLRFGITGPMIKSSMSDMGSFVRSAAYELEEGYVDLKNDVNRQLGWDGTGTLAVMSTAAVASTSIVIAGRESVEPALKFIDVDAVVDIYTSAGVLKQAGVTVVSITSGTASSLTATLTVSPAVTAAATDILVRANSYGQEMKGLLYQLDGATSTVFGIVRASYPQTQGNYQDAGGAQLTLDKMQSSFNEGLRRGAAKYSAIYTDFTSERMYNKLLVADKRYIGEKVQGDGSFSDKDMSYLSFGGVPLVADKDMPQRMIFIAEGAMTKYVLAELEFADETGSMFIAQTGTDSLECRVRLFANLFNEKPAGCANLTNYISP